MSGPADQVAFHFVIPPGEAQKLYTPGALAWKIQNFHAHPDGYLAAIRGPAPLEPNRGGGYPTLGTPRGIFHAMLDGGPADTLLVRAGTVMRRHAGWARNYEDLTTLNGAPALANEHRPRYPDQFVVLANKIIWCNGVDFPQVITGDGMIVPLGYEDSPGAPIAMGPSNVDGESRDDYYPNAFGYSWVGRIGTAGDLLSGQRGSLLAGAWQWVAVYEDIHGNFSPPSPVSSVATVAAQQTSADYNDAVNVEIDELLRQFYVTLSGGAPAHTKAIWLYRTKDIPRFGSQAYFVARLPGSVASNYPDNKADSALGDPLVRHAAVRTFHTMCTHQGRLVTANFVGDPGRMRVSEPGYAGTFRAEMYTYPDQGGAEITAVASHAGRLLAFTETTVYDASDLSNPSAIAQGIGCSAPRSIQALPGGVLIWLARDGFYVMEPGGEPRPASGNIQRTVYNEINRGRLLLASSTYDPVSREYLCAVAPAGSSQQTLIFQFDGGGWKRMDLGIDVGDMCTTADWRQVVMVAGNDGTDNQVFKLNREVDTTVYTPPARTYLFESGWMRGDDTALDFYRVRSIYVAIVDGQQGTGTIELFADGSKDPLLPKTDFQLQGRDDGSDIITDLAGVAVIGTAKFHDRRLKWRRLSCSKALESVQSWAFRISSTTPFNLAGFAFDVAPATTGEERLSRIPEYNRA